MRSLEEYFSKHLKFGNINKQTATFVVFAVLNLCLILFEWARRVDSLIGLSDEGYLYTQLLSSRNSGDTAALFSKILGAPFGWLNASIFHYRVFGLLLVFAIAVYTYISIRKTLQKAGFQGGSNQVAMTCGISVLLIPSTFRYLLMSPGYQWLIAISSIITFVIFLKLSQEKRLNQQDFAVFTICLILVLQVSIHTRLTFFLLIVLLIFISLPLVQKNYLGLYICLVAGALSIFALTQTYLFTAWRVSILNARTVDPKGYSVLNEVVDVSASVGLVLTTIFLGSRLFSLFRDKNLFSFIFFVYITLSIALLIIWLIVSRDRLAPFVFACTLLLGKILPNQWKTFAKQLRVFYLVFLSFLPITSQFGSNTPALSNSNLVFITLAFLLVVMMLDSSSNFNTLVGTLSLILALIASMQFLNSFRSFETSNDHSSQVIVFEEELRTSKEISQEINLFKIKFLEAQIPKTEKIADLSLFHPAAGLYLNHEVLPVGTADKSFRGTFDDQLNILMRMYPKHFAGKFGLVLISLPRKDDWEAKGCLKLEKWFLYQGQDKIDFESEFLQNEYRALSTMRSTTSQESLFPNSISVLGKCRN